MCTFVLGFVILTDTETKRKERKGKERKRREKKKGKGKKSKVKSTKEDLDPSHATLSAITTGVQAEGQSTSKLLNGNS